jgi:hypothetical protein
VAGGFDPKFDVTGGEDPHFFFRVHQTGSRIVWTNSAVVHECIPASRLNRGWIFRRGLRAGNSRALIELEFTPNPRTVAARLLKTIYWASFGICSAAVALLRRDRAMGLRAVYRVGLSYGMLLAYRTREPQGP